MVVMNFPIEEKLILHNAAENWKTDKIKISMSRTFSSCCYEDYFINSNGILCKAFNFAKLLERNDVDDRESVCWRNERIFGLNNIF